MKPFRWGRPLRHARLQAILAVAAMGAAVALPVVLVSVGGGVFAHELSEVENAGYQIAVSAPGVHSIAEAHSDVSRFGAVPGVTYVSPILSIAVNAFNSSGSASAVLAEGVIPGQFSPTLGSAESGLFPNPLPLGDPTDLIHYAGGTYRGPATNDVLVSSPYADSHAVHVGSSLALGLTANRSGAVAYNVTGIFGVAPTILGPVGAFAILLPLSNLQLMTGYANGTGTIVPDAADTVQVVVAGSVAANPSSLDRVRSEIQAMVPDYGVSSLSQEAAQLQSADSVLTGFYFALSSVGLAVGLLFLALVLLRRVETDRRSIGIRRAIGLPRRAIAGKILAEGLELSAAGAGAGLLGGYLLVRGIATYATSTVQEAAQLALFSPVQLGEIVLGVLGLSVLASAVATRSALRIPISEALR
ncbi:MAG TPA: ABC transporter permease [Thermoplasmata archaeon]|nr:ABC transporter permease [Thermoplasmata archaeon]